MAISAFCLVQNCTVPATQSGVAVLLHHCPKFTAPSPPASALSAVGNNLMVYAQWALERHILHC